MKLSRSKRVWIIVAVVALLALFLVRPGANRLRSRVVESISLAVGRPVTVSSVNLRLLPQPGFDLENLVLQDDPAFSAEPILRAQEVTALLRITPLFSGRVEIARLVMTEPSLNLVRNSDGHWNLESILDRVAHIPVAPTSKVRMESRPAFPYIESDLGRINLKLGSEKTAYALTDADFGVWQESDDSWGMRLKARPIRTDFNQSDTGIVRVSGTWQRANSLRETPLHFEIQWGKAQLGQLTKLVYGTDKGWRGTLDAAAELDGTPADLRFQSEGTIQDFHRYDVLDSTQLHLVSKCTAHYSVLDRTLSDIDCNSPVGSGTILVRGRVEHPTGLRTYDLQLKASDLPAQSLVAFARHLKQGLPEDLTARGTLNSEVSVRGGGSGISNATWQGEGIASEVHLESASSGNEVILGTMPFRITQNAVSRSPAGIARRKPANGLPSTPGNRFEVGPFNVGLGKPGPAVVRAWASTAGYDVSVQGDASIDRVLSTLRMLALPAWRLSAQGSTRLDLGISSDWNHWQDPRITGKAQLYAVKADLRGTNFPLQISDANLVFQPATVGIENIRGSIGEISWSGSLEIPRHCDSAPCPAVADVQLGTVSLAQLSQVFNPHFHKQPWYGLFSTSASGPYPLMKAFAIGKVSADSFLLGKVAANRVMGRMELRNGRLSLSHLRADMLGGHEAGDCEADFSSKPPRFSVSGKLESVALSRLSELMKDPWITGTAQATYDLNFSGTTAAELLSSASGVARVETRDGQLTHIALSEDGGPLQFRHLVARLELRDGEFEIQDSKLESNAAIYQLTGLVSLDRTLHIKLARSGTPVFSIEGVLNEPHVAQIRTPETQAVLKP